MLFQDYEAFVVFSVPTAFIAAMIYYICYQTLKVGGPNWLTNLVKVLVGLIALFWMAEWGVGLARTVEVARGGGMVLPKLTEPTMVILWLIVYFGPVLYLWATNKYIMPRR